MTSQIKNRHWVPNHVGLCGVCGKQCYTSRKAAKEAAHRAHPQEKLSVYRCDKFFHYGHKPYVVTRGLAERNH